MSDICQQIWDGGVWIGTGIDGLMACGTVRCLPEAMAPSQAVIQGYRYKLPRYRCPNDRHLRSCYPALAESVTP